MYKEIRSTTENDAINLLYAEMCGRHHAQRESLTIVRITLVTGDLTKNIRKAEVRQYTNSTLKFPLLHRRLRAASKKYRTVFNARRPNLFV
jgi:large subunit ribosomal protein L18Ae